VTGGKVGKGPAWRGACSAPAGARPGGRPGRGAFGRGEPQPPEPLPAALSGTYEAAVELDELERGAGRAVLSLVARPVTSRISGSGPLRLPPRCCCGKGAARAAGDAGRPKEQAPCRRMVVSRVGSLLRRARVGR